MRRFLSIVLLVSLFATGPALNVAFSQQGPCVQPGDLNTTINQRIADWIKLGDKRLLDGVPGDGGVSPPLPVDLTKALQAAFDDDTVKAGLTKASAKVALAKVMTDTAKTLRNAAAANNNQLKLGQEVLTTKGGEFRGLQANIETNVGSVNLPKTQAVISSFLSETLKRDDTGALTAQFLINAATKLDEVATALANVK